MHAQVQGTASLTRPAASKPAEETVDIDAITKSLVESAQGAVLPIGTVQAFFKKGDFAEEFTQKEAIDNWFKIIRGLTENGLLLGTKAGIAANAKRVENHEKRLSIFLDDLGIVPEEACEEDLENLPLCVKERDIFFEMDAAFLTLEWCLYTTALVEGFIRKKEQEEADPIDPQFVAEMYAQFIAKTQVEEPTEKGAWIHTLKWLRFQRLSPTARMAVVNADDKVALVHLVAQIKKARSTKADNLAELEFCALSNLRAQISAPVSQLESIGGALMEQWVGAYTALWVRLLDTTIQDKKANSKLNTMREIAGATIDTTLEKFHLDFEEWVLLHGLVLTSLKTLKDCRKRLVTTYQKDIHQFAEMFYSGSEKPAENLHRAYLIAHELAESYNPRGCTSFGCLLQQEFDKHSQPKLSAEA